MNVSDTIYNFMSLSLGQQALSTLLKEKAKKADSTTVDIFRDAENSITEKLKEFHASPALRPGTMESYNGLENVFIHK